VLRQTRAVDESEHGHADHAGEQMHSELDEITQRLRRLKRRLDARKSVYDVGDELTGGDVVEMNPLTAGFGDDPTG
jgi:hypothetical protein